MAQSLNNIAKVHIIITIQRVITIRIEAISSVISTVLRERNVAVLQPLDGLA